MAASSALVHRYVTSRSIFEAAGAAGSINLTNWFLSLLVMMMEIYGWTSATPLSAAAAAAASQEEALVPSVVTANLIQSASCFMPN